MKFFIVTDRNIISLGEFARDIFLLNVLDLSSDEVFYEPVQEFKEFTLEKIRKLPIKLGITEEVKSDLVFAFSSISVGNKFLCINEIDFEKDVFSFYFQIQNYVNTGIGYKEALEKVNSLFEKII